jgi:PKD repeat protein
VFDGLDYSDSAYRLMVGVSDLCVPGWVSFDYDTDYKVTASGLPPGLKLSMSGGYAHILGTPTKAGTYTVTLTAKRGNAVEKATFTINIDPLPGYAIGTFNGVLRDEMSGEIAGSFTFTAAATGRLSVKVVTELGTMSLSSSAWNCYDAENRPMAYFSKYSKNEDFSFTLTPWEGEVWNCELQLVGSLSWRKSSAGGESLIEAVIDTAQRNPFGKTGGVYDHPSAVKVAESLASEYKSTEMAILWDYELNAYRLECATCVLPGFSDGTATLRMNKNGTATVSGKLYGRYSFSAASVLTFDTECVIYDSHLFGEHFYAVFTPVVKMNECALSIVSGKCLTTNELVPILWFPLE